MHLIKLRMENTWNLPQLSQTSQTDVIIHIRCIVMYPCEKKLISDMEEQSHIHLYMYYVFSIVDIHLINKTLC